MKKILVPTDFSTCADNAIYFAVRSAKILPAEVTIFHVFDLVRSVYTDYMGVSREFEESQLGEIKTKLDELKKTIEDTQGVQVKILVAINSFKKGILQTIEDENIDLVIMGTSGASGLKEKLWGTNTSSIIGKAKIPVMAIPFNYQWKKPEKFLLATNHFENEPMMLDFLFEMADLYMAQVHVAIMTDEDDDEAETFLEHARKARQYEKMLKEQYSEDTLTATNLYGKEFEETLQKHIDENEIDILAMVTYQRGFWNRVFNPSKTKRMSYHTKIPLLVIQGKQEIK